MPKSKPRKKEFSNWIIYQSTGKSGKNSYRGQESDHLCHIVLIQLFKLSLVVNLHCVVVAQNALGGMGISSISGTEHK